MNSRLFVAIVFLSASGVAAYGQRGGGVGGGTGSGAGSSGGGTTGIGTVLHGTVTAPGTPTPSTQQPGFFSGKVRVDDGTPPPDSVLIQAICQGRTRSMAWTDSQGKFSFQTGAGSQGIMADVTDTTTGREAMGVPQSSGNTSMQAARNQLENCDLTAQLAGYRSEVLHIGQRTSFDNPDVGTIFLHRQAGVNGSTVSATTLMAPKDAVRAYQKGLNEAKKRQWDKAGPEFEKAVALYPKYALAWFSLGLVRETAKDAAGASSAFAEAVKADPKFLKPYSHLANLAQQGERWDELARYSAQWIQLDPVDFPQAYLFSTIANLRLNKIDDAERSAREGMRIDQAHTTPRIGYLLGRILADRGDYTGAVQCFRDYLRLEPDASDAGTVREQLAELERAAAARKQ